MCSGCSKASARLKALRDAKGIPLKTPAQRFKEAEEDIARRRKALLEQRLAERDLMGKSENP